MSQIDLNCDLGEYDDIAQCSNDDAIMPFISSCNIACAAHAGNQRVIDHTIKSALENQVSIGAHPSYPDRVNFGRHVMHIPKSELRPMLTDQIALLSSSAHTQGTELAHVKPHGALYNQAAVDFDLALLLAEVIAENGQKLMFYGLAHSAMAEAAAQVGLKFVAEGFADRGYTATKRLQPRGLQAAIIDDEKLMLQRVLGLLRTGKIQTVSGEVIELMIDTLCLHGDHQHSLSSAKTLYQGLLAAGFSIKAPN